MKWQMIVKSNIFNKINNYMSIDMVKQVFKWWDSVFKASDQSQPSLLVSLDMSAAFDTIDHNTLVNILQVRFGVYVWQCSHVASVLSYWPISMCSSRTGIILSYRLSH